MGHVVAAKLDTVTDPVQTPLNVPIKMSVPVVDPPLMFLEHVNRPSLVEPTVSVTVSVAHLRPVQQLQSLLQLPVSVKVL